MQLGGAPVHFLLCFELLKGAAELVRAGGAFAAAVYSVEAGYYVIYLLAGYQAAYALKVAVAAACEADTADDVVLINLQFDFAGASAFCSVNHVINFPFSE